MDTSYPWKQTATGWRNWASKIKIRVCLCTFSLKTGELIAKSHCNFHVLACVCEDHTQDLQLYFSSSSSRHSRILKSSLFMSGLVENRCLYKKDLLGRLSTLITSFKNQNVTFANAQLVATTMTSCVFPIKSSACAAETNNGLTSAILVPNFTETYHLASQVRLHYKNKLHLWYQNIRQSLFLLASGSLAPLGLMVTNKQRKRLVFTFSRSPFFLPLRWGYLVSQLFTAWFAAAIAILVNGHGECFRFPKGKVGTHGWTGKGDTEDDVQLDPAKTLMDKYTRDR